ncbi:methyl-accepting chemotaxis protein [Hoeflea sp. TYP-13]|uniref:methyl-accepting chemotaxis protein n=1 Tax=Hoeflea sp. TYP-13 TaxID=3230023 RepID=UPI0034C6036E
MKRQSGFNTQSKAGARSVGIGAKVYMIVGLCLAFLCLAAGTGIWQMRQVGLEVEAIAERDVPMTASLAKVTVHQLEQAINFERAFRTAQEMKNHPEAKAGFEKAVQTFEKLTTKVDGEFVEAIEMAGHARDTALTDAERKEFQKIAEELTALGEMHKSYDTQALDAIELVRAGKLEEAIEMLPGIEALEDTLDHGLEALLFEIEEFTLQAALAAEHHEQFALKLMSVIAAVAVLLGVVISIFLVRRSITRPLAQIVKGLEALNADDMSVDVEVVSNDEIGKVAMAYGVFKDNMIKSMELEEEQQRLLQKQQDEEAKARERDEAMAAETAMVTESFGKAMSSLAQKNLSYRIDEAFPPSFQALKDDFNGAVEQLSATIDQVGAASGQILSGSKEINSAVDTLASRSEHQAASVEETAAAVSETTSAMKSASDRAREASELVTTARSNAEKSGTVVRNAIEAMGKIEASADKITDIIGVIDEISFQTNLLALNAGVEAARAGEAGKGFAVVAQEVRELAQRSSSAAKEIKELIDTSGQEVKTGAALVNETGEVLEAIVSQVTEINEHIGSISGSANEQALGLQEINEAVNNIDQGTQQNAAASEQAAAASQMLADEVVRINDMLQQFDIGMAGQRKVSEPVAQNSNAQKEQVKPKPAAAAFDGNAAIDTDGDWDEF